MNITNTVCRLSNLTQKQIDNLVDAMPNEGFTSFTGEKYIGVNVNGTWGTFYIQSNSKIITYAEMMQLLGKTMQFTKSDLKTGMFVKYRNGEYRVVLSGSLIGSGYAYLGQFSNNLKAIDRGDDELDILSVYSLENARTMKSHLIGEGLKLIWERTEQTPAQKEMEELQSQISKLQEQAKVLQIKL
jgi:hypothetical protein